MTPTGRLVRAWFARLSAPFLCLGGFVAAPAPAVAAAAHYAPGVSTARYQLAGSPDAAATGQVKFNCQVPPRRVYCYGPDQIRAAYNIQGLLDSGITGAGHTIVIIDAFQSPTLQADMDRFNRVWGLPATTVQVIAPQGVPAWDPNDGNMVGWSAEISLDVQWAHAVAPGAKIVLVEARTNEDHDIYNAQKFAIENQIGDVISQSFGEGEACLPADLVSPLHKLFKEAADNGITVFASSGDSGAAQPGCGPNDPPFLSASTPASDPYVTGVGGTNLIADLTSGAYGHEKAWDDPGIAPNASGGGFSTFFKRPAFQAGVPGIARSARGVPDVSYNAGVIGGVIVAWGSSGFAPPTAYFIFGGTSAGSPQWAGITALAAQKAGHPLGFINPALYRIAEGSHYGAAFHDITTGSNVQPGVGGYSTSAGWDPVTGWGSPNTANLVPLLIALIRADDNQSIGQN